MEVVIWGITPLGKYLANNIVHGNMSVRPLAYVDNDLVHQNTLIDGIPVISYVELEEKSYEKELIVLLAVKNEKNIFEIFEQSESLRKVNLGIVEPTVLFSKMRIDPWKRKGGGIIWKEFEGEIYRVIPRIEINLIDACNLKCKGCTHFSSIYSEESAYPLENYKRDLEQLKNIGKMLRIRLLGGEPFLLNNLNEYLEVTREIFPETNIEIVTNGLLIPEIDESIMKAIKLNNAVVVISPYPPTLKKKGQILERLKEYCIWWKLVEEEICEFSRQLTLKNIHNGEISNRACLSSTCTFLRKSKIYKCPFDGLINDFYNYYGLGKKHEGGISIYQDEEIVYKEIINYVFHPIEMCKYCAEKPEYIPWSVEANPKVEDWLYRDGTVID